MFSRAEGSVHAAGAGLIVIDGFPLAGWRVCEGGGGAVRCNTTHYLSSLSDRETLKSNIDPLPEILIPAEPDPVSGDLLNVPAQ